MTTGAVCVVGSINLDLMVRVERSPGIGETVLGEQVARLPGGKGFNQAVASARSGAPARFCGAVGDDADGRFLREALVGAGLDDAFLSVHADTPTGLAHVAMLPASGNSIIVSQGANASLTQDAAADAVGGARVVLVQLEIPTATAATALSRGRQLGATTIRNAAPTQAFETALLADVDILVVNDSEAADLGGLDALLEAGARSVLVTLGSKGAVWQNNEGERIEVPAFPVTAVDTTGAGDAFCGALAAALAAGFDMPVALRRASAAGAIVATALGAQTEKLSGEAIEDLLAA
ncbi:ribokinase [Diaminobutyricimonas sp. TR449]|uniref:ribokinase n=1 Tax=Diaminobutyricimonas sp. TR449 TaxID=2708076 RepID=UPI001423D5D0|nr:ribokinase [Diaminobutyricimonas sp. TR449]